MHGRVRHILSLATGFFVDVSERQGTKCHCSDVSSGGEEAVCSIGKTLRNSFEYAAQERTRSIITIRGHVLGRAFYGAKKVKPIIVRGIPPVCT